MGVYVSKAEQVYRAASEDNFKQLEVILNRSRRKHGDRLPPELLEYNDNSNRTPLYVASKENHWRIVEMVMSDPQSRSSTIFRAYTSALAAHLKPPTAIQVLLENGAKVDHMSDMDVCGTALHAAVHNQSHRIIRLLHLYGANPFIQNARGQTAFEMIQADSQSRKHLRMFASSCPFEGEMMLDSSSDMPGVTCWCVVAKRQPHPKARLSQRVQDTQLHIYRSCRALQPLHTTPIRLDGAQVEAREGVYVLKLHRAHEDVRARFDVPRGDSGAQELTLKASGPTAAAKACVRRFAQFVNEQYQSSRGSTSRCAAARTPPSAAQADLERKAAEDALNQQETDEMLARVLQEEFDYEAALAMAEEPDMARAQPSAGTPAPAAAPQPTCSEQTCPGAQRRLDSEYFSECFMCPITKQVMSDPVMAEDGHSYERKAIEQWLATHSKSPMTNLRMGQQLKPNIALRSAIQAWSKL